MNDSLRNGTKLLTAAFIIGVVGTLIGFLVPFSIRFFDGGVKFWLWRSYVSLALSVSGSVLLIAGWSVLRSVAPPRALPFLNAALAFAIVRLMLTALSRMASLGMLAGPLWLLVFLGGMLSAWFALRALGADRLPKPADATALIVSALVIGLIISAIQEWDLAKDHAHAFSTSMFEVMSFVDTLTTLLVFGLLLSRTRALSASVSATEVANGAVVAPPPLALSPPSSGNDLVVGSIWLVGGLAVTIGSFAVASGPGGGHYFVTTGAIAYGLVRVIRGLSRR
jgi:hypothetical protein